MDGKFRKVNRINKTFFGKSAEYIIFVIRNQPASCTE